MSGHAGLTVKSIAKSVRLGAIDGDRSRMPRRPLHSRPAGWSQLHYGGVDEAIAYGRRSSADDHVNSRQDKLELTSRNFPHSLNKLAFIQCHDKRYVRNRVFRQPGRRCGQQHIPGRSLPFEITGQRYADDCADPTGIQRVTLHDHHGTSVARRGANWLAEISPPGFTLPDYHSVFFKTCLPAATLNTFGSGPTSLTTSFISSVTRSGA